MGNKYFFWQLLRSGAIKALPTLMTMRFAEAIETGGLGNAKSM
jgi:hypothetical protein